MKYYNEDGDLKICALKDFDLAETLECGQCFRFERLDEEDYKIYALGRALRARQSGDELTLFDCDVSEFEEKWLHYFDLKTDYAAIKSAISANDPIMRSAVEYAGGIRLLNQEPYECLLSFIISQNNNIPRIKGIIASMCDKYGDGGAFPDLARLRGVTEEQLFELKTGFRNKYIYDAVKRLDSGDVVLETLFDADSESARRELLKIKGVGPKVADCVLLFSLGHRDVFPIDVWVRRVMSNLYFDGSEQSLKTIADFAAQKWGGYAGYAQQYLFYFARSGRMKGMTDNLNKIE